MSWTSHILDVGLQGIKMSWYCEPLNRGMGTLTRGFCGSEMINYYKCWQNFLFHSLWNMRNWFGLTVKNYLQRISKYWRLHCSQRVSLGSPKSLMSFLHTNRIQQMCDQHSEAREYFHMEIDHFDCMHRGLWLLPQKTPTQI